MTHGFKAWEGLARFPNNKKKINESTATIVTGIRRNEFVNGTCHNLGNGVIMSNVISAERSRN